MNVTRPPQGSRRPRRGEDWGQALVVATHPEQAANQATLEVTVDAAAETRELLLTVQGLEVPGPEKRRLLRELRAAERDFRDGATAAAVEKLLRFRGWTRRTGDQALFARANPIITCVGSQLAHAEEGR